MHSNRSAAPLLSDTVLLLVEICESDLRATRHTTTTNCTTNDVHTPLTRDIVSNTYNVTLFPINFVMCSDTINKTTLRIYFPSAKISATSNFPCEIGEKMAPEISKHGTRTKFVADEEYVYPDVCKDAAKCRIRYIMLCVTMWNTYKREYLRDV